MQFNEKLKELRLKKGISQTALAEKIFVSRSAVAKWENGLGLPSDDSLNQLAEFFGVERAELYSDKATEAVIVEKNKTISKAYKWVIVLSTLFVAVLSALILVVVIKNLNDNLREGTEVGIMVGVNGEIYEYDEIHGGIDYTKKLTNAHTEFANDYILEVGKTYILAIGARQSGGSIQIGLYSDGITFLYDNDIFNIELISENGESVYGVPLYYINVKAECQFSSVVIGSNNFFESLIVSTTKL